MATQLTTASPSPSSPGTVSAAAAADPTPGSAPGSDKSAVRADALRSWADLKLDPASLKITRQHQPVPTYVRLSRLIGPDLEPAIDLRGTSAEVIDLTDQDVPDRQRLAYSLGRPLYQIGLAALVAATAVGVYTFAPLPAKTLSSVEPTPAATGSEPASPMLTGGAVLYEQHQQELIDLFGAQQSSGASADLAIAGAAESNGEQIQWTASIRNLGPAIADQPVRVIHTLPIGVDFVSSIGDDWDCLYKTQARSITCDLNRDLGIGQTGHLGVITTDGGASIGTKVPSTMAVIGRNSDVDLSNNTIIVVAVATEATASQSSSVRSSGGTDSSSNVDTSASTAGDEGATTGTGGAAENDGQAGHHELPETGTGLTAVLAAVGLAMCLAGRRLLRISAEYRPIAIEPRLGR
ncbi:MAG: DUF11 domain-containing protein [Acidimicrobiia bacterium]|nr:DUF11 domain-containing protein [Acidimicrobiia bacterium]